MSKFNEYIKTTFYIILIINIAPSTIRYIQHEWINNFEPCNKVGYLEISGPINNSSTYKKTLTGYFQDHTIKAILLKIESNGGTAGSCQALAFDIENLKKEFPKPIITYTENMCTSGAYQIAAATDHIVTTGSTIIGSIGVTMMPIFNLQELLKEYKIFCQEISAGQFKNTLSPFNTLTDEQKTMLQTIADNTYQQLTKEIAHKRHLQLNKIDQWGQGKLFTGQQAYDLKLVDALGSKTTAVNLLKKNIIPSDRKISWIMPAATNKLDMFLQSYGQDGDN